jgi:hypothetical protein
MPGEWLTVTGKRYHLPFYTGALARDEVYLVKRYNVAESNLVKMYQKSCVNNEFQKV